MKHFWRHVVWEITLDFYFVSESSLVLSEYEHDDFGVEFILYVVGLHLMMYKINISRNGVALGRHLNI